MNIRPAHLVVVVLVATSLVTVASPAQARSGSGGHVVVHRGPCSGPTDWKLKVGAENGRLEVEGEVDSNRAGQTWTWRIVHNGSLAASGTRRTAGPSGSFGVRRVLGNQRGTDTVTLRAENTRSGEVCRGTVRF